MNTFDGHSPSLIVHFSGFDVLTPTMIESVLASNQRVSLRCCQDMLEKHSLNLAEIAIL